MYKVDIPVDDSTERVAARRRAAEVARQERIFNTRNRIMGLDIHALDQQVAEKREREQAERQRDLAYDALCLSLDQMLMKEQREEEERKRELAQELEQYRATYQRAEDSTDADINYKHREPSVSSDDLKSVGPASMQVFQGEGADEKEKKQFQMEQNGKTLRAQRAEREKHDKERKHHELLWDREQVKQDLRAVQLDTLEEECKRAACIALKSYNQAQAEERLEQERQAKLKQDEVELAELIHMVTSDMLTERPETSERGPTVRAQTSRALPDRFKGMSSEQLGDIYRQREEQRADRERHRQLEKHRELVWGFQQLEEERQQVEEERRLRELERERRAQLDRYNQQLAKEQRAHQQYLKDELYTNRPSARFFTQFNTSSR